MRKKVAHESEDEKEVNMNDVMAKIRERMIAKSMTEKHAREIGMRIEKNSRLVVWRLACCACSEKHIGFRPD